MYIDFNQMKEQIDEFQKQGKSRLQSDWLWMEIQGAGRLEKRLEEDVEVEKFVVADPQKFLDCSNLLRKFYYWKNETL